VFEELQADDIVCLFTLQMQYVENSWLHGMTNFNGIRYRPVTEFLTLNNVQLQEIYKRRLLYMVKMCYHTPWWRIGLLSFVETEEAFKLSPRTPMLLKML